MYRRALSVSMVPLLAALLLSGCGALLPSAQATPTLVPLPPTAASVIALADTPTATPVLPTRTPSPIPPSPAPAATATVAPTASPAPAAVALPTDISPTSAPRSVVDTDRLNVRTGPGTAYARIGQLLEGDEVVIVGRNADNTWWQIAYAGPEDGRGWVSAEYISTDAETARAPVVEAPPVPPAPAPAHRTATGLSGKILFQEASGGRIFSINADGTELAYLTDGMDPEWSPDGNQIAFARWAWDPPGIFVMSADGSDERQVVGGAKPKGPAWSADGSRIAFTTERNESAGKFCFTPPPGYGGPICITLPKVNKWKLQVLDLATGHVMDPASDPFSFAPSWSPDSTRLVYDGVQGLRPADPIQGHDQGGAFIDYDSRDAYPVWSPTDDRIAFMYDQNGHWEIYAVNADGSGRIRLTESPLFELAQNSVAPEWSPDGQWIAFLTDRRIPWEIWVMRADGSQQQPLFPPGTLDQVDIHYDAQSEHVLDWRAP